MKLIGIITVLLSLSAFGSEITLSKKEINLGNISDVDSNTAVNKRFNFLRNSSSPETVTVKYTINFLKAECVNYEVKKTEVADIKKMVCSGDRTGYVCEDKTFTDLYEASVVCAEMGFVRDSLEREVTLNFKKAVALSPKAVETFALFLKQPEMKSSDVDATGSVLLSSSLYEVKKPLLSVKSTIIFKAK